MSFVPRRRVRWVTVGQRRLTQGLITALLYNLEVPHLNSAVRTTKVRGGRQVKNQKVTHETVK